MTVSIRRRHFTLALPALAALAQPALARSPHSLTLGMTLEPPGLDPTAGAASAIAEIMLYNVFETLTKIRPDASVGPLLAQSWHRSPDLKQWTFHLRDNARFSNGAPLTAQTVQWAFTRAASEGSTNKDRRTFTAMRQIAAPDERTVRIELEQPDADLPFKLGQATAIIVEPGSAAGNATRPVGSGPYVLDKWQRGASLTLKAWPQWREAGAIAIGRAVFRFISDPAAQVAALLAGDVDAFVRMSERGAARLKADGRFALLQSGSRAKTIVAFNHRHAALRDVRVRRALCAAIDRQAVLQAGQNGLGTPIGSYYTPGSPGYVDLTGVNAYDPDKARQLLKEALPDGPLSLTLTLPPTPYARQGGEVVAAQLSQAGVRVKVQNVEWAQWLSHVYGQAQFDLTLISHVEPLDLGNWSKPGYYWGYENPAFDALYERLRASADEGERLKLLEQAQRLLAEDAAAIFLYQPHWLTAARKGLQGLWEQMPISVNDLATLRWQ